MYYFNSLHLIGIKMPAITHTAARENLLHVFSTKLTQKCHRANITSSFIIIIINPAMTVREKDHFRTHTNRTQKALSDNCMGGYPLCRTCELATV